MSDQNVPELEICDIIRIKRDLLWDFHIPSTRPTLLLPVSCSRHASQHGRIPPRSMMVLDGIPRTAAARKGSGNVHSKGVVTFKFRLRMGRVISVVAHDEVVKKTGLLLHPLLSLASLKAMAEKMGNIKLVPRSRRYESQ